MVPRCPVRGAPRDTGRAGSVTFHSRIVPSSPALASVLPSGLNTALLTQLVCPVSGLPRGFGRLGSATFHSRTVRS
jgi:hypothetical protein